MWVEFKRILEWGPMRRLVSEGSCCQAWRSICGTHVLWENRLLKVFSDFHRHIVGWAPPPTCIHRQTNTIKMLVRKRFYDLKPIDPKLNSYQYIHFLNIVRKGSKGIEELARKIGKRAHGWKTCECLFFTEFNARQSKELNSVCSSDQPTLKSMITKWPEGSVEIHAVMLELESK